MKNNRGLIITVIVLLCAAVLLLSGIMVFAIAGSFSIGKVFDWKNSFEDSKIIYDESFDSTNIKNISARSQCGDIKIKHSADDAIRIVACGANEKSIDVKIENSSIHIIGGEESNSADGFPFNRLRGYRNFMNEIEIYLPDKEFDNLDLTTQYGDVDIENHLIADLKANVDYGDIEIKAIDGSVDLHADCGDIEIDNLNISSNSSISTDLGNVEIERTNDIRIDYELSMGDSNIKRNFSQSDVILNIKVDLGDIDINDEY